MPEVTDQRQRQAAFALRELLGAYRDHEDLISVGAYRRGSNQIVDAAIDMQDEINAYLRQPVEQPSTMDDARAGLMRLQEAYLQHSQIDQTQQPAALQQGDAQQPAALAK